MRPSFLYYYYYYYYSPLLRKKERKKKFNMLRPVQRGCTDCTEKFKNAMLRPVQKAVQFLYTGLYSRQKKCTGRYLSNPTDCTGLHRRGVQNAANVKYPKYTQFHTHTHLPVSLKKGVIQHFRGASA